MKSFKKIALIVSAALLGSVAVVSPAHAGVPTVAVTVNAVADNDANTVAGAAVAGVPADNKVEAVDAVKFALTGIDAGTAVVVTTTKATVVPALHTVAAPVTSKSTLILLPLMLVLVQQQTFLFTQLQLRLEL